MQYTIIYSESFIEFLKQSDCRVAKILYRIYRKNYIPIMLTDSEVNYITFRQDGTISYLPNGKEHKTSDEGTWKRDGRQNGKPGKIIKKLFTARAQKWFKDADFECFANSYKANFNDDGYTFELLPNKQIPNVYEMERANGEGSLNNSCMNGDSEYLAIYKNCKQLQILILKDKDGLLCGRSLVWTIDTEITLIDRIYTTQDFMFDKFLMYAANKNWWRKRDYKTYDNKEIFVNPKGEILNKQFEIETNTDYDSYPYIDTFSFGNDGTLNNHGGDYTYNNTDGERDGGEDDHNGEVYDEINEEYISEDDSVYIDGGERRYRDRTCHVDNAVCINDTWYYEEDDTIVQVNGTWYKKDDSDLCEINGDYHLMDDCTFCQRDNCYYLQDDCVYCEDDEEDVLRDEAVEVNDEWYHKESDKIVEIDDQFYLIDSDEIELKDGEYRLIEVTEDETN